MGVADAAVPPLNVLLLAIGTFGDVQPFLAVGVELQKRGHRVRLASHACMRHLADQAGLEFFPLRGDPQKLAEFAAQAKGIFPRSPSQASNLRFQVREYLAMQYAACTEPDPDHPQYPFKADAIIANPISYGHIHCADKLGVPLHILFTMPWHPTGEFAHPQARFLFERWITSSKLQQCCKPLFKAANRASFAAVDGAMFLGTADLVNDFRTQILQERSLFTLRHYNRLLQHTPIPTSYVWSPSLLPRPADWPEHANVTGFCQLRKGNSGAGYTPPQDLADFLAAGPPPVYIGFGSMKLKDPQRATRIILGAVAQTGQRVILGRGWGGLGGGVSLPAKVLAVGEVPHDWLFPCCAAAVHHGGSGTCAASLAAGCPTTCVPFFGDQAFWGDLCRRVGVGDKPTSIQQLTAEKLVRALRFMMQPQVQAAAQQLSACMAAEPDGAAAFVDSFHRHLQQHQRQQRKETVGRPHEVSISATSATSSLAALDGGTATVDAVLDKLEQGWSRPLSKSVHPLPSSLQRKYLQPKRLPYLTFWSDYVAAGAAVMLLPFLALLPCTTSLTRPSSSR